MSSSNPALKRAMKIAGPQRGFDRSNGLDPYNAVGKSMDVNDVIMRTLATFAVVLVAGGIAWAMNNMLIGLLGAIIGFVLAIVNSVKKEPSPPLILAYAGFEGLFLGSISGFLEQLYPGIVIQAVLATLSVFAAVLFLFTNANVRATPKLRKFFLIAIVGYLIFSLTNVMLSVFNVIDSPWGLLTSATIMGIPLGIFVGIFAVVLASISLIIDFTDIEDAVRAGLPEKMAWYFAFALTVTIVWLYVEMLRLIAITRD